MEHYSRSLRDAVDRILRNDEPPLQRIRAFFDQLLTETAHDADNKGCLLVNTLLETPAEDHEITRRAAEAQRYIERTFTELLEEAKARGELADDVDCCKQAKLLMTGIFGLRVYAKMEPSEGELSSIIESLLEPLMRR